MPATKPLIIQTGGLAWRDSFRVIAAMPIVAGIAFTILILLSLVSVWIVPDPYALATSHWLPVFTLVSSIVSSLLLAPLAIAVHRYVLLGELTNRYPLDPFSARYVRFVGFAMLSKLLWSLPTITQGYIAGAQEAPGVAAYWDRGHSAVYRRRGRGGSARHLVSRHRDRCPGSDLEERAARHQGKLMARGLHLRSGGGAGLIGVLLRLRAGTGVYSLQSTNTLVLQPILMVPTLCAFAAGASHIYRARADSLAGQRGTLCRRKGARRRAAADMAGGSRRYPRGRPGVAARYCDLFRQTDQKSSTTSCTE